ncbi:MAG: SCO family protein [Gemmatimonadetes bacterium]|nr:SCO family protein [Gemmatimonadota bacterium]
MARLLTRVAAAVLAAALVLGTACRGAPLRSLADGLVLEPGFPKPAVTLTDTEGRPFRLREDTDGQAFLLFFGYTHCPDVCPVHMQNIAAALTRLPPAVRRKVRVLFVTTDPARDTPAVLRTWLDHFDPTFVGLRGDSVTIAESLRQLHLGQPVIQPGSDDTTYTVGHSASVLAFSSDNLAHVAFPFGTRQQDWVRNLPLLVDP